MRNVEFINAGAGSGKTTRLVKLICDNIGSGTKQYKPGELILTTFTEMAAAEFNERARSGLLKAGKYDEAKHLSTASIGTVHAIANSFVNKYWYRLGRGPVANILSDADKKFYINQSLADVAGEKDIMFFKELYETFGFSTSINGKSADDPDFWKSHLESIVNLAEQYNIRQMETSIEKSCELIDTVFNSETEFDNEFCRNTLKNYIAITGSASRKSTAEKILEAPEITLQDLLSLVNLNPVKKEKSALPAIDDLIIRASAAFRSQSNGELLKKYVERLFQLAALWITGFREYKTTNSLIDYNDMEVLFLELLNMDDIAEEFGSRYRLLMVDEFQDSSPLQLRIFDRLSEIVDKTYWVGDPKQAIYGFRGTDVALIKAVAGLFNNSDTGSNLVRGEPLKTSYRSRPGLVELSNTLFRKAFDDIEKEDIELSPDRNDNSEFGNQIPSERLHWHMKFKADGERKRASNADHYDILSQKVIKIISEGKQVYDKDLKCTRSIEPHDIAILCRTSRQVSSITETLRSYGLAVSTSGDSAGLFETAEIKLFLALLDYTLDNRNDLARAELLHLLDPAGNSLDNIIKSRLEYMPRYKSALEELEKNRNTRDIRIPVWQEDNELLLRVERMISKARNLPVTDLTDMLITGLDLFTCVSAWGDAKRRISNLEKMKQFASEYDQRCLRMGLGASLNNFIVYLRSAPSIEEKARKVKGAINVLTYHRSKGLEWNMVILESLDYNELHTDDLLRKSVFGVKDMLTQQPCSDNLFPERYINLLPWFAGAKKSLPPDIRELFLDSDIFKSINSEVADEVKRLLYVGLTRARDYIVTSSYNNDKLNWLTNIGCPEITPSEHTGSTIDVFGTSVMSEFEVLERDYEFEGIADADPVKVPVRKNSIDNTGERYFSPSNAEAPSDTEVKLIKDFGKRIPVNKVKKSNGEFHNDAEIGTCIHDIFCVYRRDSENNTDAAIRVLESRAMKSVFPEPVSIIESADKLFGLLEDRYGKPVKVHRELPVQHLDSEGRVTRGNCDLVWETETEYILVDYKTFQGGIKQITTPGDKHYAGIYAGQLDAYSEILEETGKKVEAKLVYYTLSGYLVNVIS